MPSWRKTPKRVLPRKPWSTQALSLQAEINYHAQSDYIKVARETIKRIRYNSSELGFDANGCAVALLRPTVSRHRPKA
ncbi:S-adenosylmethionine synthetase N-terminal domain-containing protein [Neisseria subflava]|uniref:S-adenosylmethionine synthetase N-terminal domain-containing protein n=1 Tax=Neisseria subflava TaxID=28449 RepID=UPI0020B6B38F|nr:S-adenosylmethionine synthetase N-terminal domain-containing protein [Neisseria subflava]